MAARIAIVIAALLLLAALAFTKYGIATIAGSVTGTNVSIGSEHFGVHGVTFRDVAVRSQSGEPLATIASAKVGYHLNNFTLQRPDVTLIRHKDGTWNFALPKSNPNAPARAMNDDVAIHDGAVTVIDESQGTPGARKLYARNIDVTLHLHTAARTQYAGSLAYVEGGVTYPIRGAGDIDASRGYAVQRWKLPPMPIARLVDFAVNSPSLHLASGSITGGNVQVLGLSDGHGGIQTHVVATTTLQHVRLAVGGLVKPVRDLHGRIDVFNNGLTFDGASGTIAGVPLTLLGGIYDLRAPSLRIAMHVNGDVAKLRGVIAQAAHLPVHGNVRLAILLEGRASSPVAMIALDGKRLDYAGTPIDAPHGLVAFSKAEFDLLDVHGIYHGIDAGAQGRVALTKRPNGIEVIAGAQMAPGAAPFVGSTLPGMPLRAMMLALGNDASRIQTMGVIDGTSRSQRLAGRFAVDSRGVGSVGPVIVSGSRGSLYAQIALDHPRGIERGYVRAQDFRVAFDTPQGSVSGTLNGSATGSLVHNAPAGDAALVLTNAHYQRYAIGAMALVHYAQGALDVRDTAVRAGPALVALDGTVHNAASSARTYDLNARAHAVDVAYNVVHASVNAKLHVGGSGTSPTIAGTLDVPVGDVNGQAFRDLRATLNGTPAAMAFNDGGVKVDETAVAFNGIAGMHGGTVSLNAPHAELDDFNDLFNTGETLGGNGSIALTASYAPGAPIVTSGHVNVRGFRYRRFDIGNTVADWHMSGGDVQFVASAGGANGSIRAYGRVNPATYAVAANASVRRVALATWLPLFGINEPLLGNVDANAIVSGRFPDVDSQVTARLVQGNAFGIPVQQAQVALRTSGGEGRIDRAIVRIPGAAANVRGSFGLHARDPLNVTAHITSPDIGAVAREAGIKAASSLAGALDTTATLRGTRLHPQFADALTLTGLRYNKVVVPRVSANAVATMKRATLQRGEIDLAPGRVLLTGSVPLPLRDAPFSASMVADDVELAQFAPLLPANTALGGRIDGRVSARGRTDNPKFAGTLSLANGSYSSDAETVPIGAKAQLAFHGDRVRLRNASVDVGGGALALAGVASVPSVRDMRALAFTFDAKANNARIDAPAYYKGIVDGEVTASRVPAGVITLGGGVALSSGRVPLTALFNPSSGQKPTGPPLPIAFNYLNVSVGNDVRVQSPNVDIGAQGGVTLAGTLAAPSLTGSFVSTGGTVSFYRTFTVEDGTVSFDPNGGIIPYVDATALTTVDNPYTNVRLHVTGPADSMQLALASSPAYSRSQILGLLAGVGSQSTVAMSPTGGFTSLAEGQLNTVFTRNLLEPLGNALGGAFGLNDVNITDSLLGAGGTGFGASFVKHLGKSLSVAFAQSFSSPRRQSITVTSKPNPKAISLSAVFYTQDQPQIFGTVSGTTTHDGLFSPNVLSIQPMSGTNGVDFKLERTFP